MKRVKFIYEKGTYEKGTYEKGTYEKGTVLKKKSRNSNLKTWSKCL